MRPGRLDVYLTGTNAPHYSAYNRVEHRMAPLSRELAGLVLPQDHYGTHLDGSGKTKDAEKEKLNFAKAGTTLAEVWSQLTIDNHDVVAKYIDPTEAAAIIPNEPDARWVANHVRTHRGRGYENVRSATGGSKSSVFCVRNIWMAPHIFSYL